MIEPVCPVLVKLLNSRPSYGLINVFIIEFVLDRCRTEVSWLKGPLIDSPHYGISINELPWNDAPISSKGRCREKQEPSFCEVFYVGHPGIGRSMMGFIEDHKIEEVRRRTRG